MKHDRESHFALSLLKDIIAKCVENRIPFFLIRPHSLAPEDAYEGDIDFLLPFGFRKQWLRLLHALSTERGISFSLCQVKRAKLVVFLQEGDRRKIKLELWGILDVRDPKNRTMRYIEWKDVSAHVEKTSVGYRLEPQLQCLYYISHLYSKNKNPLDVNVKERIAYYRNEEGVKSDRTKRLLDLIEETGSTAPAAIEANSMLCDLGVLSYRNTILLWFKDVIRAYFDNRYSKRMLKCLRARPIAVLGPDGSGKTTFIKGFCSMSSHRIRRRYVFKWLFRHSLFYRVFYPLLLMRLKIRWKRIVKRNQVDDYYSGIMFMVSLLRYAQLRLRAFLVGRYIVDRYYYDLLIRNLRFPDRGNTLTKWWAVASAFIPRPAWMIQLDVDAMRACMRKTGIKEEDVDYMRTWMFSFYLARPSPWYSYVNTTANPVGNCLQSVEYIAKKLPCYSSLKNRVPSKCKMIT